MREKVIKVSVSIDLCKTKALSVLFPIQGHSTMASAWGIPRNSWGDAALGSTPMLYLADDVRQLKRQEGWYFGICKRKRELVIGDLLAPRRVQLLPSASVPECAISWRIDKTLRNAQIRRGCLGSKGHPKDVASILKYLRKSEVIHEHSIVVFARGEIISRLPAYPRPPTHESRVNRFHY